ncbi:hypothetical protein T02_9609, partial [Trichinella nativa]
MATKLALSTNLTMKRQEYTIINDNEFDSDFQESVSNIQLLKKQRLLKCLKRILTISPKPTLDNEVTAINIDHLNIVPPIAEAA